MVAVLFLSACGLDFPGNYHCDNSVFKRGIHSVLPIDCSLMELNAAKAINSVVTYTADTNQPISERLYRQRMQHVQVLVRSVWEWNLGGDEVSGDTYRADQITIDSRGESLMHESLHAFDMQGWVENFWSFLATPVESLREQHHDGWSYNGFWAADYDYQTSFCYLRDYQRQDCPVPSVQ